MTEIITRDKAVVLGLKRYYTGQPCDHGHVTERYVKQYKCVECSKQSCIKHYNKDKQKAQKYARDYRKSNREKSFTTDKNSRLKRLYGVSLVEYNNKLEQQKNQCEICGVSMDPTNPKSKPCIDHDHSSGKVRGIICNMCNIGLGKFNDDISVVSSALVYLQESKWKE